MTRTGFPPHEEHHGTCPDHLHLIGVPAVVLTDRTACLKAGIVANVVVPHPEYVQFATHFGFKADFCEGADPESKGSSKICAATSNATC